MCNQSAEMRVQETNGCFFCFLEKGKACLCLQTERKGNNETHKARVGGGLFVTSECSGQRVS